jgi:hypothetical protein
MYVGRYAGTECVVHVRRTVYIAACEGSKGDEGERLVDRTEGNEIEIQKKTVPSFNYLYGKWSET